MKEKKQSGLWKQMEEPNIEKKYLVRMWKKLNISSKTWRGVMMLQMEGFLVCSRKAAAEKKPEERFCKWCKDGTIATTHHIVCCCRITKKEHMNLHDDVAFWIWKTIAQKYKVFPEGTNKKDCPKVLRGEKVEMSFGIEFLKDDPKYPSTLKPDIVVDNRKYRVDSGCCNSGK